MSSQAERLAAPFRPDELRTLNKGGTSLTYVSIASVLTRLNDTLDGFNVVALDAWPDPNHPDWIIAKAHCVATIDGEHREAIGYGGQQIKLARKSGLPVDLGDEYKGATSDAIKKAVQQWGVLLYLARDDDEAAVEAERQALDGGWVSLADRTRTVRDLMVRWNALTADGVDTSGLSAWIAENGVSKDTMTEAQALELAEQIARVSS